MITSQPGIHDALGGDCKENKNKEWAPCWYSLGYAIIRMLRWDQEDMVGILSFFSFTIKTKMKWCFNERNTSLGWVAYMNCYTTRWTVNCSNIARNTNSLSLSIGVGVWDCGVQLPDQPVLRPQYLISPLWQLKEATMDCLGGRWLETVECLRNDWTKNLGDDVEMSRLSTDGARYESFYIALINQFSTLILNPLNSPLCVSFIILRLFEWAQRIVFYCRTDFGTDRIPWHLANGTPSKDWISRVVIAMEWPALGWIGTASDVDGILAEPHSIIFVISSMS